MADSATKKRAAARREAILNSRGNRLAKLTSSARGDEASSLYDSDTSSLHGRRSSPAPDFLGEETLNMPRPSSTSPSPARPASTHYARPTDVEAPISQQQEDMMRALFSGMGQGGLPSMAPGLTPPGVNTPSAQTSQAADPFAAMLAQFSNPQSDGGGFGGPGAPFNPLAFPPQGGMPNPMMQSFQPPPPKPFLLKLAPLLHAISAICLIVYFVFRFEPTVYSGVREVVPERAWDRWASLARYKSDDEGVQAVPLFYAFTTLQVILHSIRIYYEPPPQPPSGILGMIVTALPHPFPFYIVAALKYVQMSGAVLDDLCVLLFAVGFVVWGAGWAA